jgi:hypothetical protein
METQQELSITEILAIYHRKRGLPKGTTEDQWRRYHADTVSHNAYYDAKRPNIEDFNDYDSWNTKLTQWLMDKMCSAPNEPGYYRANND